jgi:ABC-type multidrug transport system fused ATPase/permease subunit
MLTKNIKNYMSKPNYWLASVVKQNWQLGFLATTLGLFASILEGLSASLILPLTTYLSNPTATETKNVFPQPIEKIGYFLGMEDSFFIFIAIFLLLIITKNTTKYWSNFYINKLKFYTGKNIRETIIRKFLNVDIFFFNSIKTGHLTALVNEHAEISQGVSQNFFILVSEFTTIICLLSVATYLSYQITLISFLSFGFLALGMKPLLAKMKIASRKAADQVTQFTGLSIEILDGIKVIKAFNLENSKINESQNSLESRCNYETDLYAYACLVSPLTESLGITVLLLVIVGFYALGNSVDILPVLLTYTIVMLRTIPRINYLNNIVSQFSTMDGSVSLIYDFLHDNTNETIKSGSLSCTDIRQEILLQDIRFKYPNSENFALNNLSLRIQRGQKIALVGQSGSGKSTLVDLLMRLYDPCEGNIYIDGIDLKKLNLYDWRSLVAIVSQETFLFYGNIKENICYGRLGATDQDIQQAAENAYAMEFIEQLPYGMKTMVGQRGTMLSGGQKQRIAIARAFLRDPQLLILDEATSALDTASEVFVQKAIDKISEGRTVITIAHRLSTIKNADVIVTMKSGKIIEMGTHEELLANKDQYWKLHNSHNISTI